MISELSDVGLAFGPANVVGWAHVRWEETQDVDEPNLSFYQFMSPLLRIQLVHVWVGPSMSRNLVSFVVHSSYNRRGLFATMIDQVIIQLDA